MIRNAKDLRAASYNPRQITQKQMQGLASSIEAFGDLSGIVFNETTKTLVSGHQRTASMKKWPSKAVLKPHKDQYGTVKIGHMEFKTDTGIVSIPMRVVAWDRTKEKQANIAANAHGGDWDKAKLATLTAQLEKDPKFQVDIIGLDPHDLKILQRYNKEGDKEEEAPAEFESVKGKAYEEKRLQHCCPKCKHKWSD